jgi:formylglycine-generating enzyme required for sulfatase activity
VPSGTLSGTAVYNQAGTADVDNCGGLSPYGTMGQGGNVWEWMETERFGGVNTAGSQSRQLRGASYNTTVPAVGWMAAGFSTSAGPAAEANTFGFRVASIIT